MQPLSCFQIGTYRGTAGLNPFETTDYAPPGPRATFHRMRIAVPILLLGALHGCRAAPEKRPPAARIEASGLRHVTIVVDKLE